MVPAHDETSLCFYGQVYMNMPAIYTLSDKQLKRAKINGIWKRH